MRNLSEELKNKKIEYQKLLKYGFIKQKDSYIYEDILLDGKFKMLVQVIKEEVFSKVLDIENNDEYLLVDVKDAKGEFVGKIKEEYEEKLQDIIDKCFIQDVFKKKQTKEMIQYIKEKYQDELEFLWEKFTNNAVVRNKVNQKWYGIFFALPANKLGIDSSEVVEVLNVRYKKENIEEIIDYKNVYPGYHMNKKSWISIKLDGNIENSVLFLLIDNSYDFSLKGK